MIDNQDVNSFYVYVHRRLSSGHPFYVGKGRGVRAHTHKGRNPHWKNIVAKEGGRVVELIAECLTEELAFLVEMEAIDRYRRLGFKLVNRTDGGEGVSGYRNPNGAPNKGKPCPEEMKARISATLKAKGCRPPVGWNKGKKTPAHVIDKKRAALRATWAAIKASGGRQVSLEARAKMSAAKLGYVKSAETRQKLSASLKANEYIRTRPNMTGFRHSDESRAKMSQSMRGRKANNRRPVRCLETGELFESATAAAKRFGREQHTLIAACCSGKVATAYGHRFAYLEPTSDG